MFPWKTPFGNLTVLQIWSWNALRKLLCFLVLLKNVPTLIKYGYHFKGIQKTRNKLGVIKYWNVDNIHKNPPFFFILQAFSDYSKNIFLLFRTISDGNLKNFSVSQFCWLKNAPTAPNYFSKCSYGSIMLLKVWFTLLKRIFLIVKTTLFLPCLVNWGKMVLFY